MSAPAHTPGPWLLSGETIYALDETGGCNRFSCQVQGGYSYHGRTVKERTPEEEIAANARLIAAAPELLEALEAFVSGDIDVSGTALIYDADLRTMLALARAAIAKATGGQHERA